MAWCPGARVCTTTARRQVPAPLAPPLGDQLEGSLRGAEIRQVQGGIRVDHPHHRDVRKSSPLAIIWVPTRMSISRRPTRSRIR